MNVFRLPLLFPRQGKSIIVMALGLGSLNSGIDRLVFFIGIFCLQTEYTVRETWIDQSSYLRLS